MARARSYRRRGDGVAFKIVFGRNGRAIAVEDGDARRVAPRPLASVKPRVFAIEVPLEVIKAREDRRLVCYVHLACRAYRVPCG